MHKQTAQKEAIYMQNIREMTPNLHMPQCSAELLDSFQFKVDETNRSRHCNEVCLQRALILEYLNMA